MIPRYAFLLLATSFCYTAALAQVTLVPGDISYVPGESFPEAICSWVAQGPSGPGQSWDFSSLMSIGSFTSNWITPFPNYPTATVAFNSQSLSMHYEATPAAFRHLGTYEGISLTSTRYSDPADEVRYPFSIGSSYTDAFEGWSYFPAGGGVLDSSELSGTLFVEADAYGTLMLPWGTVNSEVIRIHKVRTTVTDAGTSTEEEYRFHEPGVHHPWLKTYRRTNSWSSTVVESARYYNLANVGIEDLVGVGRSLLFPNPAGGTITLRIDAGLPQDLQLSMLDAGGRVVSAPERMAFNGIGSKQFDLSALPVGVYTLFIDSDQYHYSVPFIRQ